MSDDGPEIMGLVREIRATARERRATGEVPEDLERSVEMPFRHFAPPEPEHESPRIREALQQARQETSIDDDVPTGSRRPYLVPVKRAIRSVVSWYVDIVVARVQIAIRAVLRPVEVTSEVVESLEDRVEELEAQVAKLERRLDSEHRY